jgi:hypothetical protein
MKAQFPEFYRPSESDFRQLWQTCILGLDANVLLNLYGYSDATREQFLSLLERLGPRIRMPYQFAWEYQRNRNRAIMEQVKNYAKAEKALSDLYDNEFAPKHRHPFLSDKRLKQFDQIRRELTKNRQRHESFFKNDPYFDRITNLVSNVSAKPTDGEIQVLFGEAKIRYAAQIPPGYADLKEKGEPAAYGDFIGWKQFLEIAKVEKKPAILITDDTKEDWWLIQGDRTVGPRPELISEFSRECGSQCYLYSSDQFMKFASTYLDQPVEPEAIAEIAEWLRSFTQNLAEKKGIANLGGLPTDAKSAAASKPVELPPTELATSPPKYVEPSTKPNDTPKGTG